MKNPHGVEPTRYMKREESSSAISCSCFDGPNFCFDIYMKNECDMDIYEQKGNMCCIKNNGDRRYGCHPEYKSSLYMDKEYSYVSDYEVFGIDYENRKNINKLCKHPDIIMEYIETKDISGKSLEQFDDNTELLSDLNAIHCHDREIKAKISRYCFKELSELLPDTQLVNKQYDDKLKEWLGNDCKWKLLYRASEHEYSAESFHRYCNYIQGPNLIVIKSSGGWIFGGYTTQSWSDGRFRSIYYDMIYQ